MSKREEANLKGGIFVIGVILLTNYSHYGLGLGIIKSGLLGFTLAAILFSGSMSHKKSLWEVIK